MAEKSWIIEIKSPFGGLAPAYFVNSYPSFGRSSQAGSLLNIDITDPTFLTQGKGLANLTNGTQAGVVTEIINHILNFPSASDTTWGIGATKLFKISSSTVASGGTPSWPQAITNCVDGRSVVYHNGNVYGFYNKTSDGDILKMPVSTKIIDPDWGSTIPVSGAAAILKAPHPAILGGQRIFFGNGRYVGYYKPSTDVLSVNELDDLPEDCEVVDLVFEKDFLFIATNRINLTGSNITQGAIYTWDTLSASFQEPIIEVAGKLGTMFLKNGIIFVFYQELSSSSFKLGYINGDVIQEVASFSGSLPTFGQVCHYKNLIAFISNGLVHTWGTTERNIPVALSQIADGGYDTVGVLANPFGTPMVASTDGGTNFRLAKFSGYDITGNWKSLDLHLDTSVIEKIRFNFEPLASGALATITLRYNRGASSLSLGTISFAVEGGSKYHKTFTPMVECESARVEIDWTGGSATNPVSIRSIIIQGRKIEKE